MNHNYLMMLPNSLVLWIQKLSKMTKRPTFRYMSSFFTSVLASAGHYSIVILSWNTTRTFREEILNQQESALIILVSTKLVVKDIINCFIKNLDLLSNGSLEYSNSNGKSKCVLCDVNRLRYTIPATDIKAKL